MNHEDARLQTFELWPSHVSIDPRGLAKSGFFYVGEGTEVQCFSCGKRVSEWGTGEDINELHRRLDPNCRFLNHLSDPGNRPELSLSNAEVLVENLASNSNFNLQDLSSQSSRGTNYKIESVRLETFEDWPIPAIVSPQALARAGFYYLKQGDMVCCAFCHGRVCKWEVGDDPVREHRKLFPSCSFHETLSASRSNDSTDWCQPGIDIRETESSSESTNLRELGVQSHKVPKHPTYATPESRLRTYTHWPRKQLLKPKSLAEAGFFYLGCDDHVRCFHCDGGLKLWDPTDDPWKEHARWFPDCGFILLVKGEDFVKEATFAKPPVYDRSLGILFKKERESLERRFKEMELKQRMMAPRQQRAPSHRVTSDQLRALMDSPQARAVILLGLEASRVKMAIKEKLERTGTTYASADALAAAALNIQHEEIAQSELEDAWTTPPESPMMNWIHQSMRSERARGAQEDSSPEGDNDNQSSSSSSSDPTPGISENQSTSTSSSSLSSAYPSRLEEQLVNLTERVRACNQSRIGAQPSNVTASIPSCSSSQALDCLAASNLDDSCRSVSLEEENRLLKEARLCKICMDSEVRIVFLPCGHLVTCARCATSLPACPVCRQPIKATVKTFLS